MRTRLLSCIHKKIFSEPQDAKTKIQKIISGAWRSWINNWSEVEYIQCQSQTYHILCIYNSFAYPDGQRAPRPEQQIWRRVDKREDQGCQLVVVPAWQCPAEPWCPLPSSGASRLEQNKNWLYFKAPEKCITSSWNASIDQFQRVTKYSGQSQQI